MKGYKATRNMRCRTMTYEVGKTYSISSIQMCSHGFHFCPKADDVLEYYTPSEDLVLLEVESIGNHFQDGNKVVCDKMKVLGIVPNTILDPKYLTNPKLLAYKNFDVVECDERGNAIHVKNEYYEGRFKYDDRNNRIYEKSGEYEKWFTYDENNNLIYSNDSNELEKWWTYKNNKCVRMKTSMGYEEWNEYDENGNNTLTKTNKGWWRHNTYNEDNLVIHTRDHYDSSMSGLEQWYTYDGKNQVHYKNSNGHEQWATYENNNLIALKNNATNLDKTDWKITIE